MLKHWCLDNIKSYENDKTFEWEHVYESGGRGSGKTRTAIEFAFYFLLNYEKVRFVVVKPAGTELHGTWKDLKELVSDIPATKSNNKDLEITLPNGNYIKLYGINQKFLKSPKVGLSTFIEYNITIILYDECYTLDPYIITNFNLSLRSADDKNHKVVLIYTFNPWLITNEHVKRFRAYLPPDQKLLETKGIQIKKFPKSRQIFIRTNYRWKRFLRQEAIDTIEAEKVKSYKNWQVISLGMDGSNQGGIFETALNHIRPVNRDYSNAQLIIGIDWGESTLNSGGKNVAVAIMYSDYFKQIDIVADNLLDNAVLRHDTKTLMLTQIKWAAGIAKRYFRNVVTVWVDNGSSKDFYRHWQELANQNGILNLHFQPITNDYKVKMVPTQLRIDIVSFLLSNKQLGIADEAKAVWESFKGMYYETHRDNPNNWVASHYLSDAFDAFCYALNYNILKVKPMTYDNKASFDTNKKVAWENEYW